MILHLLAAVGAVFAALVGWFAYEVWRAPLFDDQGRPQETVNDAELLTDGGTT